MTSPIREKIARAWESRVNLDYERCLGQLAEIKERLGIPAGELSATIVEELARRNESTDVADTLMLSASLRRALGDPNGADAIVEALDRALGRESGKRSFRFYYEKGRVAFSRGDFHAALEEFLRASFLAGDDRDRLWALGNVVFCMENLGLPYGRTLEEVRRLLDKQHPGAALDRVRAQLHAFQLRALMRAGRLSTFFEAEAGRPLERLDQGRYFAYWLRLLPYHRFYRELVPGELDAFSAPSALHHPFYKLRTLQGMLHPEDLKGMRPSESIDRLYLWVWRWLGDPSAFPIQRLLTLLEGTDWQAVLYRCTVEDSQLLRNALLWLGLFDPGAEGLLHEFTAPLEAQRAEQEYPLLKLESHVVQYFLALRRGDAIIAADFRQTLETHPLWRSEELRFRQLVEAVGGTGEVVPALAQLVECLRELLPQDESGSGLIVDLAHHQLIDRRRGLQIVSEPMCQALRLLRSGEPVTCDRFVQVCFGLSEFDPLIHTGKIFNLLSRLKKAVGDTPSFHMKTGAILARGDWSRIVFREGRARVNLVPVLYAWKRISTPKGVSCATPRRLSPVAPIPARRNPVGVETIKQWDWRDGLSRGEVERLLGLPRSTTNRWIAKWVDHGVLRVKGKARTTRYFLSNKKGDHEKSRPVRAFH